MVEMHIQSNPAIRDNPQAQAMIREAMRNPEMRRQIMVRLHFQFVSLTARRHVCPSAPLPPPPPPPQALHITILRVDHLSTATVHRRCCSSR